MKITPFFTILFLLLAFAASISLQSCKNKKGCTDSSSPHYDPEATQYELGSCDGPPVNIEDYYGSYSGSASLESDCSNSNFSETVTVGASPTFGYIYVNGILNFSPVKFLINGNQITAYSQTLVTSPSIQLEGGSGEIELDHINFELETYHFSGCGYVNYYFSLYK